MDNCENVGPRQPWHDIHAKVEGPIALDIKQNFEERWIKLSVQDVSPLYEINEDEFILDAPAVVQGHLYRWTEHSH